MPRRIAVDTLEPDPTKVVESSTSHVAAAVSLPSDSHSTHSSEVDTQLRAKSGSSPMSAFCAFPEPAAVQFEGEIENEDIVLFMRAHVVTNVPWIITSILMLLVPLVVLPILAGFNILPSVSIGVGVVVFLFWYSVVFTFSFIKFLFWYFNVYIVTNERLVDVDWHSILYRNVSTTQIKNIEDVKGEQSGVFAGLFDFGNVYIQTAGTENNFEFIYVPHPQLVVKKIQELMQREENS